MLRWSLLILLLVFIGYLIVDCEAFHREPVNQGGPPGAEMAPTVQSPAPRARLALPIHVLAKVSAGVDSVELQLRGESGEELSATLETLPVPEGDRILIGSLDWLDEGPPPFSKTQPARLVLRTGQGRTLTERQVIVIGPEDPAAELVDLYWLLGEALEASQRRVVRDQNKDILTVAIEELLWGPSPRNLAGFHTAIPTPSEVLAYPGRNPEWGYRVTLLQARRLDGSVILNFSAEMRAYGGGSARVEAIRRQIEATTMQFPGIREVRIQIAGEEETALEP
jgi:hypothetical protein